MDTERTKDVSRDHAAWLRFDGRQGSRAVLTGADLSGADLSGAEQAGADLRGADMSGANLKGAYLKGLDLSGARLFDANLKGAYLARVCLTGADLTGADLRGAHLTRAHLTGAVLTGADLTGACLSDAYLTRAYLSGAVGAIDGGTDPRGYRFVAVRQTDVESDGYRIAAGCRWFTPAEAWAHWRDRHDPALREEIDAILYRIDVTARARGWVA